MASAFGAEDSDMLFKQTKATKYESRGAGELSSLIMNTLGSTELKREWESDTSAPSLSPTVSSRFTLC